MGKTKKYTLFKAIFRYSLRNFVKYIYIYIYAYIFQLSMCYLKIRVKI